MKKTERKISRCFTIPESVFRKFRDVAKKNAMSMSGVVSRLILEWVEKQKGGK